jgi:hypothetical protein
MKGKSMDNQTQQSATAQTNFSPMFIPMMSKMGSDMKFVGLFHIIYGALNCLTIIGAIIGVPFIIAGLRLRESGDSFSDYLRSNNFQILEAALERTSRFISIYKVLIIIYLVLIGLGILFLIIFGLSMVTLLMNS